MNRAYLDSLPEVRNKYGFQLKDNEKVVFTCKLAVFGTSQGAMLGGDNTVFALTNQRIMAEAYGVFPSLTRILPATLW